VNLLILCRAWNALFAAAVCIYSFYIAGATVHIETATGGSPYMHAIGIFFLLCFANVHNDIVDFEIDKINRPKRPLPSGKISLRTAYAVMFACLFLAIGFGFEFAWLFVAVSALCFVYNKFLKGLPLAGNFMVALLTTTPIAIPILKFGFPQPELLNLMFFAFTLTFAREITKDIEDMKGDKALGLKTIPVLLGVKFSLVLVFLCEIQCLAQLAMFKLPVFFAILPCLLLSAVLACLNKIRLSQTMIKVAMVAGLVAFYCVCYSPSIMSPKLTGSPLMLK